MLHILKDYEDARECENDTYFKAWNVMPPKKPEILQAFLGKITRNLSLDRYQMQTAKREMVLRLRLRVKKRDTLPQSGRMGNVPMPLMRRMRRCRRMSCAQ